MFYGLVYDNLVAVDQDMNPKPNLAVSWNIVTDISPHGSVWQYNLTHNAVWHDGEPFTADDVVFTISYQTGPNFYYMWDPGCWIGCIGHYQETKTLNCVPTSI